MFSNTCWLYLTLSYRRGETIYYRMNNIKYQYNMPNSWIDVRDYRKACHTDTAPPCHDMNRYIVFIISSQIFYITGIFFADNDDNGMKDMVIMNLLIFFRFILLATGDDFTISVTYLCKMYLKTIE